MVSHELDESLIMLGQCLDTFHVLSTANLNYITWQAMKGQRDKEKFESMFAQSQILM